MTLPVSTRCAHSNSRRDDRPLRAARFRLTAAPGAGVVFTAMKRLSATAFFAAGALTAGLCTTGCGGAPPKPSPTPAATRAPVPTPAATPTPSSTPKPQTYTEVLKTFPRDRKACRTLVYLQDVGN